MGNFTVGIWRGMLERPETWGQQLVEIMIRWQGVGEVITFVFHSIARYWIVMFPNPL